MKKTLTEIFIDSQVPNYSIEVLIDKLDAVRDGKVEVKEVYDHDFHRTYLVGQAIDDIVLIASFLLTDRGLPNMYHINRLKHRFHFVDAHIEHTKHFFLHGLVYRVGKTLYIA